MIYTRRELLRLSAMTVGVGIWGVDELRAQTAAAAPQAMPALTTSWVDVRRNVTIFNGRGGTIGVLVNSGGVLVVDSQFSESATICVQGVQTRAANRSIDVLVNTHHHADHIAGNAAFRAATKKIVAQAHVPELAKANNELATAALAARNAAVAAGQNPPPLSLALTPIKELTLPDSTFTDTWKIELGDEVVSAKHYGPGHTGGDCVVFFERANVVHVADLAWNTLHPFVDRPGGASVIGQMHALERIMREHDQDAIYVIGHAGAKLPVTGSKALLIAQRDYFTALLDYTRAKIKAGTPREVFIALKEPLPKFPEWGPLLERTLAGTFDELSAAK
jgi:glyoxylase-like metal-dependent hydrolase (beta-lactamase superfamily II)